ncbi:outer membrane lipoprotein LolB [Aquincola sp. MAHUQ-54]|uniref:Outer-membrane lipoprotein LolB n=1 Tax=Aquincola agrisoli TaxID=3119538 RepID=A0AAW9QDQ2_9BURK
MKARAAFGLLALAWLAGCATLRDDAGSDGSISGRLAVQIAEPADRPGDARNVSAQFELRGDAALGELNLSGPLGNTLAQARWQQGQAELLTTQGTRRFDSLDAMSQEMLGEPLPLAALIEWLRGRPWAAAVSHANDAGFEQLGWQIDLSRYAEGWLTARRAQPPATTVRVRLDRSAAVP